MIDSPDKKKPRSCGAFWFTNRIFQYQAYNNQKRPGVRRVRGSASVLLFSAGFGQQHIGRKDTTRTEHSQAVSPIKINQ
jgi:hypothetical protein